jgi:aminopeptidase N
MFLSLKTSVYGQENILLATPNKERLAYNVHHYELDLQVSFEEKKLKGHVTVYFELNNETEKLSVDLHKNLSINRIIWSGQSLPFKRIHRQVMITFPEMLKKGSNSQFTIYYEGSPLEAKNPPWSGGFTWYQDTQANPWLGVSCQGDGASTWWPNKDLLSDEADSVTFSCTYPDSLFFVSNGNLYADSILANGWRKTTWKTHHPINNYNITMNIGNYTHFSDTFQSVDGAVIDLDYYVLKNHLKKAKKQFTQVKPMLRSFEKYFGAYPFPKDGYALVETPYLGMEHQSAIAYGNQYKKGYLGAYPKEIDFDFIIIHESGHEWWGNSVSMKDRADMWIHESFCTYSEALYVEDLYGYESMLDYLAYQRKRITHDAPLQGVPHTHKSGHHTDIYFKGTWVLHTLRNIVADDRLWLQTIKKLSLKFRHQIVTGEEVKDFLEQSLDKELDVFFKVYLDQKEIPRVFIKRKRRKDLIYLEGLGNLKIPIEIGNRKYILSKNKIKIPKKHREEFQNYLFRHFLFDINLK